MKKTKSILPSVLLCVLMCAMNGCAKENTEPLWKGSSSSSKTTVVISDLHLGIDSAFAETVANIPYLTSFLKRAKATENLDELVIAGDMLDGWFMPFSYGVVDDYSIFYKKVAAANQGVVDAVNAIIKEGRIQVTYIPGNHDVDLSRDIVESIFPGIGQARDSEGVGTYKTGFRQEVAIEHGHRYNVFCAPDSLTDKGLRQGKTLLGPGYFYTRIAATSLKTGHNPRSFSFPDFGLPENPSETVANAYKLYRVWEAASKTIGVADMTFDSKVIPCGIAGYKDFYSFADLVPLYRNGVLTSTLFQGIDSNWMELQLLNRVNVLQEYGSSVLESASLEVTDQKAYSDYFDVDKSIDVVVFGHTHAPLIQRSVAGYPGKIYVNSGTWIDHNLNGDKTSRAFVKIVSSANEDEVSLCGYETDGSLTLKA